MGGWGGGGAGREGAGGGGGAGAWLCFWCCDGERDFSVLLRRGDVSFLLS